jgi:hypothetical protein
MRFDLFSGENATCPQKAPLSCSFDNSFCKWQVFGFDTLSSFGALTLPSGKNFALATSTSASGLMNPAHSMISPELSMTQRTQISFLYFVSGSTDVASVALTITYSNATQKVLWSLTANPRVPYGQWLPARINLCQTGTFRLSFEVLMYVELTFTSSFHQTSFSSN